MTVFPRKSLGSALIVFVLAVIISVLGILQYRSTQRVSDATARDMEESLQSTLFDFRHALERELAGLCLELQAGQKGSLAMSSREVARRLKLWRQNALHPELVPETFLWEADASADPISVSPTGLVRRVPWPSALTSLPLELANITPDEIPSSAGSQGQEEKADGKSVHFGLSSRFGWLLDQQNLVLLHPTVASDPSGESRAVWLIVPLSHEFVTGHLLPELIRHEFGGHIETYQVAVIIGGSEPSILYSSQPGFGSSPKSPVDASLNLFGPPTLLTGSGFSHGHGVVFPAGTESAGDLPPLFIDPLIPAPPGPMLTVLAKHRQGSVEAAVASLRDRNMAVSFGVLAILAVTLTLVAITSHRARALAQMQMDFVAGVSHELRTPLTAILLAARNLEDGVVGENGLVRYGAAIKNHAAQLSGLVEEILLFAETHSGGHVYKIEPLDVALGIQNTLDSLAPIVDASGFTVEENVASDLPLVQGDAAAFSQCLQNLITNSLKYGGAQQWVGIRACVAENSGRKEIRVSVEDHGIGIQSGELKQIFEPFYRSPEVVDSQILGNGLGLPLTKTMVEAMGGKLTVISERGKGSTFTLHLRPIRNMA
jgi:two-component system, OmpR family, sensor histidine kinase SenX3